MSPAAVASPGKGYRGSGWFADIACKWDWSRMSPSIRQTAASTGENMYWPSGTPRGGIVCLHGSEGGWAG